MALEIFKLVGSIFVDNKAANESLAKTDSKAEKVGKTLLAGAGKAAAFTGAVVAGAAAAVGGLVATAKASASACDNIDKQSQKLSMSAKRYQELDYVCQLYGTDVDKMGTAMKNVTTAISSNSDALKTLGVSTTDSSGQMKSAEDVLIESIDALKKVSNETERNALANQLFGKSYQDMLPMLNDTGNSMADMCQKADDLGLVMSDDMVKSGATLTDTLTTLKEMVSALGTKLGAALMPILNQVCEAIISYMPQIQALASSLEPVITQLFGELLPPLMDLASSLIPIIINLIIQIIPPITQVVKSLVPILVKLLQMILPPIVELVSRILPILVSILEPIIDLLDPILDLLAPILELVMAILEPIIDLLQIALKPLITYMNGYLSKSLQTTAKLLTPLINGFSNLAKGVSSAFNAIKSAIKLPHFSINPSGWKIADLLKGSIPRLGVEWYAKGGVMNDPTAFGVNGSNVMVGGENGPEAIAPIETLQKYITDAVAQNNSMMVATMTDIFNLIREYLPECANTTMVLDSGALVAATVEKYDQAQGQLIVKRQRGAR